MAVRAPFHGIPIRERQYRGASISENYYPAGMQLQSHVHERAFFCLIVTGEFTEDDGNRETSYRAGSVIFHPPMEEHSVDVRAETHCLNVEIDPALFERLAEIDRDARRFSADRGPLLWNAMRAFQELRSWSATSPLMTEGLLLEMLADVAKTRLSGRDRLRPRWLDLLEEVLQQDFAANTSVSSLAASLRVHPVHMARTFRRFHGCSVIDYRQRLRVDAACARLAQNPLQSLAELAVEVGFSDQTHFSRVFRQMTGMSPGAFRTSLHPRSKSRDEDSSDDA